jgi:TetR/AcrR family transcriptional regulator, regulator of cefoperazone and chloramphenicol sensitivity
LRSVAEAAGISVGLVQHYYGTKSALIEAVDDYAVRVISDALVGGPLPPLPEDPSLVMGRRITTVMAEQSDVVAYIGRALVEGDSIGAEIFDGLLGVSKAQRDRLVERNQLSQDLDPLWTPLNVLLLRLGPVLLRSHIERHLPEPFNTPTQLERWDDAVMLLIRGQMQLDSE